jgi:tetratricopeptide (TPR) repeat protein
MSTSFGVSERHLLARLLLGMATGRVQDSPKTSLQPGRIAAVLILAVLLNLKANAQFGKWEATGLLGILPPAELDKSPIAPQIRARLSLLQLTEARELAASLINQEVQNYEGYFWMAFVEFQQGKWHSAVRRARRAEKLRPIGNAVQKVLALTYLQLGQDVLFQQKMKEAIELERHDFAPHYSLGRYLQSHQKNHKEAAKHYLLVIERKPDHYEALYYLGLASEAAGDVAQAKSLYQRALAASEGARSTFSLAYQGLSRVDRLSNLPESALKFARQAVILEPKLADNHFEIGKVYVALGRLTEAVDAFKASLMLDASQSSPYYQLFALYRRLGDSKAAEQALAEFRSVVTCYGKDE